MHNNKQEDYEP